MDSDRIIEAVRTILVSVGEDPEREGLLHTPERVGRMYEELLAGYTIDARAMINQALFDADVDEMVIVRNIEFSSLCEHHLLPFVGHAHVAYLPNGKVIGLSKIPRVVDMFARRLQIQEHMTRQIADFLMGVLNPHGVAVVVDARHMCASMRGVKKSQARMVTSAMCGAFKHDARTRGEFMQHIDRQLAEEL
ncbi:MAG: GTP cyclohydrolase I FolE [Anaerolineales bacterium]|nr:GTP cyclohydrolase I FolE [Anaerolineales bacterium]